MLKKLKNLVIKYRAKFWYNDIEVNELSEVNEEHIKNLLLEGFYSGELVQEDNEGNRYTGWWRMVDFW